MERHFIVFPFFITMIYLNALCLNLSWWRSLLYRNQSFDFLCKSMDWFLYDNDSIMKELIDIHILVLLFNLHTESRVLKYKWKTEYAHQKSIQWNSYNKNIFYTWMKKICLIKMFLTEYKFILTEWYFDIMKKRRYNENIFYWTQICFDWLKIYFDIMNQS